MEKAQLRRPSRHRKKKRMSASQLPNLLRPDENDDMMEADEGDRQATSRVSIWITIIYYMLLFLKVGLWITFVVILSQLHLGAPCFLLPLTRWLYSGPMNEALRWAKRRLWGPET